MNSTEDLPGTTTPPPALAPQAAKSSLRKKLGLVLLGALVVYVGVAFFHTCLKPLPTGLGLRGDSYPVGSSDVEFLADVTGVKNGQRVSEQAIFDRALKLIDEAQDFVLVDTFLFNDYLGKDPSVHRKLCAEVSAALLTKKQSRPGAHLVLITDPLNSAYGGPVPDHFKQLQAAGIIVVPTDLRKLRDSNPAYSSFWRMFVQWFGSSASGSLPHPLAKNAGGVAARSWLQLLNFKANHRKLLVADAPMPNGGRQLVSLVMSANPHDGSSAHGNVGLLIRGGIWRDLVKSEQAVLTLSGSAIRLTSWLPDYVDNKNPSPAGQPDHPATVRVLTEAKIQNCLVEILAHTGKNDTIDVGMFYLSERGVIKAMLDAARRGTIIRVLLDPNRDAFGYQKNGIPNRPIAEELMHHGQGNITVRWYDTHGEQFHSKLVLICHPDEATLFVGSANLTRRNIGDFNLETDVVLTAAPDFPAIRAAHTYFDRLWTNQGLDCSVPYETYADRSKWKKWEYRFQEWSGLSTF